MALTDDGTVFAFGWNEYGQCGVGKDKGDKTKTPTRVQLPSAAILIACGSCHTLIILDDGSIYSCGYNAFGQLGHGNEDTVYIPKPILALKDKKITKCAGEIHSICVDGDGNVWTWG